MEDWEREQIVMARDSWEDEEEEVVDSWDAEEEEEEEEVEVVKAVPVKKAEPATKTKPVTTSASIASQAALDNETEQDRKERLNRLIQESDLENAMALFGISKADINVSEVLEIKKAPIKAAVKVEAPVAVHSGYFESASPQTWSEFESLSAAVVKKFKTLDTSKHYPNFLETLFRTLLQERDVPEIRKLVNMANEVVQVKQKDKLAQINGKKKAPPSLAGASKKTGRSDMMDFGDEDDDDGF